MNECRECKYYRPKLNSCSAEGWFCRRDADEIRKKAYQIGKSATIRKIYNFVKREWNPAGKPSLDYEVGLKIMNYLKNLNDMEDYDDLVQNTDTKIQRTNK